MVLQLDLSLVTWVIMINACGYWLSRTKVKEWAIPIPFILACLSVLLVTVWGFIVNPVASFADFVHMEASYAFPNGIIAAFCATELYDVVHETTKRKAKWCEVWNAVASVFKKGENNG